MPILTITGSARPDSSNVWLLQKLAEHLPQYAYRYFNIADLPLFQPTLDQHPWPPAVVAWRQAVATADAVIIATPEYIHNIPALLKNALEWVTSEINRAIRTITNSVTSGHTNVITTTATDHLLYFLGRQFRATVSNTT